MSLSLTRLLPSRASTTLPLRLHLRPSPSPAHHTRRYTAQHDSSAKNLTRPCPSCQTPLPLPTTPCPQCSTLLPLPTSLSPHALFGLSAPVPANAAFSAEFDIPLELASLPAHGYAVDAKDVRNRFLQRQRELHPDKFSGQGERVVALARELSGMVNEGYGILNDPLKRAEYILAVHALAVTESEQISDPSLLAEVLEAREELESAADSKTVDQLRVANHEKVESTIAKLTEAFSEDPPNLAEAKSLATQLKYWMGLEAAAKEWQPRV